MSYSSIASFLFSHKRIVLILSPSWEGSGWLKRSQLGKKKLLFKNLLFGFQSHISVGQCRNASMLWYERENSPWGFPKRPPPPKSNCLKLQFSCFKLHHPHWCYPPHRSSHIERWCWCPRIQNSSLLWLVLPFVKATL